MNIPKGAPEVRIEKARHASGVLGTFVGRVERSTAFTLCATWADMAAPDGPPTIVVGALIECGRPAPEWATVPGCALRLDTGRSWHETIQTLFRGAKNGAPSQETLSFLIGPELFSALESSRMVAIDIASEVHEFPPAICGAIRETMSLGTRSVG